jgi:hypothetical protein
MFQSGKWRSPSNLHVGTPSRVSTRSGRPKVTPAGTAEAETGGQKRTSLINARHLEKRDEHYGRTSLGSRGKSSRKREGRRRKRCHYESLFAQECYTGAVIEFLRKTKIGSRGRPSEVEGQANQKTSRFLVSQRPSEVEGQANQKGGAQECKFNAFPLFPLLKCARPLWCGKDESDGANSHRLRIYSLNGK